MEEAIKDLLHRDALVADARRHVYVADGTPIKFTEPESERIAFVCWLIEQGRISENEPKGDA